MNIIYKYPLEIIDRQQIELPAGSSILTVQVQNNKLWLWALVDPSAPPATRHIHLFGTGQPMSNAEHDHCLYINTVQHSYAVWHFFEHLP